MRKIKWWEWVIIIIVLCILVFLFVHKIQNRRIVASFMPSSKAAFQYNTPTILNDNIYIGSSSRLAPDGDVVKNLNNLPANFFYKMDLDLNVIWKYPLGGHLQTAGGATLDSGGNIYFVVEDFSVADQTQENNGDKKNYTTNLYLYSLTGKGQFRWKQKISNNDESWIHAMINCAIDKNNVIYVGGKKLFAFDDEGNIKWQYPTRSTGDTITDLRSSPIIDNDGNIYFVSPQTFEISKENKKSNIFAYKFDNTGKLVWSTLLDNQMMEPEGGTQNGGGYEKWMLSSPAFGLNQSSLVAAVGSTINKVDTATGKILWSLKPHGATGSFKASPAIDDKDNIYIGTKSNNEAKFYAIRSDGTGLLWVNKDIASDMYSSPLLGDDGKVYVGSEYSKLNEFHALDIKTGDQIWGLDLPDSSFGSPVLYKSFIYAGIFQYKFGYKTMYKIKADASGYLTGAAWPRFHGSNSNNGRSK